MTYGLKDSEIESLRRLFSANEHVERAVLYGSRAKGNYKPFSDIDSTLEGDELTYDDWNRLKQTIDDLLMPYEVDLNLRKELKNPNLLAHIDRVGVPLYIRK